MKTIWNKLRQKINSLNLRERKLITLTLVGLMLSLFLLLAWNPAWIKYQNVKSANYEMAANIEKIKNDIQILEDRSKQDVNLPYRIRLEKLKGIAKEQQEKINNITSALIQPEKMNLVFNGLLDKSKLKFESIKNLEPKIIELKQAKNSNQVLYEHGLVIDMKGQYLHSLDYIKAIENQSWQLYWDEVQYKTTAYPMGELKLKVHTLSTSNKILGL